MVRRHGSESNEDSPVERRGRYDPKTSSKSHNRRNDSSDSDRGHRETVRDKRDDSSRVRDRRGKIDEYSDSDSDSDSDRERVGEKRKGSEREKSRNRQLDEEASERGRVELKERDGYRRHSNGGDGDVERKQSSRHDKEDGELVSERKRDGRHRRGKVDSDSDSDSEDDSKREKRKESEREKSRNRSLEDEEVSERGRVEGQERKRVESPKISDEEDSDVERKRKRHRNKEDGELVLERGTRDRRHRSDHRRRKHDHESSEDDGRSRRDKEHNGKSRNDNRGRDNDEIHRRRDRRRSPRIHGRHREEVRRDGKEDHRESKDKESHMKVDQDAKAQKQPTEIESNPAGNAATLGRTGGVYIPPFKLARMMKEVEDKSSAEYQRLTWDALRKSINGLVNKVNGTNIKNIIPELLGENLIRGRGLFCRAVMKSQFASPGFTHVFAALVAVVNTKFPQIGDLLLRRIVLQLRRAYKRNDKPQLLAAVKFVAHLVNQQVAHELIALELLTILLDQPTDDSVEVAVGFVTDCGAILQDLSPKGLHGIFERFRGILHEGEIDKRVQFLIEGLFAIRKAKFQGHPAIRPELDLVEPEDQLTHEISIIDEDVDQEISLDIFKPDPDYLENEKRYEDLKKSILGEESEEEDGSDEGSGSGSDDEDDNDDEEMDEEERMEIQDQTETNLVNLRRTIYLTIMSSVDFEEAGHKLLKIKLEPGQEMELCIMLLECCSQERTYLRYYGLLGQRFCMINRIHQENFETCFVQQYSMIHRLETNKLRNVAKFFAHLLGTFALPWHVLSYIRLTEEDTTSSSRIFIKILFQELSEHLGIRLLNERLNDPTMQDSFESIFPRDNPRNTRFAINFFTSIGLGGITENLREYLKNMPRLIMQQQKEVSEEESESESESSSDSGSESEKSESSSDREKRKKRRR